MLKEQIAMRCVHFTGIQHKVCKAGVIYAELEKLPCITFAQQALTEEQRQALCPLRRLPTQEEIDAENAMWGRALELILVDQKSPCCQADLVAHESGRCTTKTCSTCGKFVMRGRR